MACGSGFAIKTCATSKRATIFFGLRNIKIPTFYSLLGQFVAARESLSDLAVSLRARRAAASKWAAMRPSGTRPGGLQRRSALLAPGIEVFRSGAQARSVLGRRSGRKFFSAAQPPARERLGEDKIELNRLLLELAPETSRFGSAATSIDGSPTRKAIEEEPTCSNSHRDDENTFTDSKNILLGCRVDGEVPSTSRIKFEEDGDLLAGLTPHSHSRGLLPDFFQDLLDKVPARARGLVMLNILVVLVATNWVVVKEAGTAFDPFMFASLRFGVAAAALSPFLMKALRRRDTLAAGIELGLLTAAGYLAQSEGLLTTDASRASFLSTFTVLVVPFLAGVTGRGVRPLTWAAAVTALVGVSLLEQGGAAPCAGDAWSILSAVAFGVQIFRTEHYSRVLGRRQTIPLMSVVLATTAVAAAVAAGASHVDELAGMASHVQATAAAIIASHIPWAQVLYTGLLTTDVALLMELVALRDVTSTEAAIIYTMEPVLGAGMAFAVLGERWGPMGWVGAALIVGSCLAMQFWGSEHGEAVLLSESDVE